MPLNCGAGEDSWESLKEIKSVHPKRNKPSIFFGRADAEVTILWPPDENSQLIGQDLDAGKDWGQEEKGKTEDEIVGWHHWLNGHELSKLQEILKDRKALHAAVHWSKETWLSEWKTTTKFVIICCSRNRKLIQLFKNISHYSLGALRPILWNEWNIQKLFS